MEEPHRLKNVVWMGSSRKDLKSFPDDVKRMIGHALYQAQIGGKDLSAKPLSGLVVQAYSKLFRTIKPVHTEPFTP